MLLNAVHSLAFIASVALQSSDDLTAPPPVIGPPEKTCDCSQYDVQTYEELRGLVVDAELTLGADGLSVNDRQATIFKIDKTSLSNGDEIVGRTRIWHYVSKSSCGVTFDYGRKYSLAVQRNESGEFETNACLMKRVKSSGAQN